MSDGEKSQGLISSVRALIAQTLALLLTRGELAALELQETRDRCVRWAALGLIAAVLLLAALVTLSLWVAAVFWDGPRGVALGLLAVSYGAVGVALGYLVRREVASSPPLLAQTRVELEKDREALRNRSREAGDDSG
jgi:uncharacterized membrane protein YqjE